MELAKPALDIGLYVNQREACLAFWQQQVGLAFDELLPLGGGVHQLRHRIGESILKINHARAALAPMPAAGYRRLSIARDGLAAPLELTDPEGNSVRLVPAGHEGIEQLQIDIAVRDMARSVAFYGDVMQFPACGAGRFAVGRSLIRLFEDSSVTQDPEMRSPGYRYSTIQVFDVVGEHAGILARGGREGRAPVRLGEVAYISFVRDPDGNWIEVSQRKSLTGSLA